MIGAWAVWLVMQTHQTRAAADRGGPPYRACIGRNNFLMRALVRRGPAFLGPAKTTGYDMPPTWGVGVPPDVLRRLAVEFYFVTPTIPRRALASRSQQSVVQELPIVPSRSPGSDPPW